ncbi:MAG: hypothetical protein U9O94_04500 [Nanoarchaeota archaeon]|nr:hypothetical protein [Nanoarchaeota archaeon]
MDPNYELLGLLNSDRATIVDGKNVLLTGTVPKEKMKKGTDPMIESIKFSHAVKNFERFFHRFKPIFVLCDEGTSNENLDIVVGALEEVLESVGMNGILPINVFGYWNKGDGPHRSVDWYIDKAFEPGRQEYDIHGKGQCDIAKIWHDFKQDPVQAVRPHYDVLVLSDVDIYASHYKYRFLIGEGPREGTILGITRYKEKWREIVRQGALHEFGHTFADLSHCGQVNDGKKGECTMKFPNSIPADLETQAEYRKRTGILFCDDHSLSRYSLDDRMGFLKVFPELEQLYNQIYARDPWVLSVIDSGKLGLLKIDVIRE